MKQNKETIILLEDFMKAMDSMVDQIEDTKTSMDLTKALGEININGADYQIQVSLTQNKKFWQRGGELRFSRK